ncbi:MAG: hypothetical protein WEC34_08980 [Acidimicrobiia bacterium]
MGGAPNPEGGTADRATRAPAGPVMRFADAAKRLGAATRAAGLTVPAFRCPPRVPGARRTVRRYPGGAVVSVVLRDRAWDEVASDMVEGVVVVNRLEGEAALRMRTALLEATGDVGPPPSSDVPSSSPPPGARVAERQTQAA